MIEDEIITFFFAGALTIQVSTANLIMYSICLPQVKEKLMAEIDPQVRNASMDIDKLLNIDETDDKLVYTKMGMVKIIKNRASSCIYTPLNLFE